MFRVCSFAVFGSLFCFEFLLSSFFVFSFVFGSSVRSFEFVICSLSVCSFLVWEKEKTRADRSSYLA